MAQTAELQRKIYFFRAELVDPTQNPDWLLPRKKIARLISELEGKAFYLEQGEDRVTCAEVHDSGAPQALKFYAIRRQNLPSRDDGTGRIGDLGLQEKEGLAEAVHVMLFPNSIIGFEAFFYGPRVSRVEAFINQKCASATGAPIVIKQLYRRDALERAQSFSDIRTLRVKMRPQSNGSDDQALRPLMEAASALHAVDYADVTFRTVPGDEGFGDRVKQFLARISKRSVSAAQAFENLEIYGRNPESDDLEPLNLLNEALYRVAYIPRQGERTRALDTPAAFSAIKRAHQEVRDQLPDDAVPV
jgi:hypothetical protein